MQISPVLIGKVAGAVAVVAVCIPLYLWSRADYSIEGTIQVDTGAYPSFARNIDVRLIHRAADEEMQKLVTEYKTFRDFRVGKTLGQLRGQAEDMQPPGEEPATPESDSSGIIENMLRSASEAVDTAAPIEEETSPPMPEPDERERENVKERIWTYARHETYCRDCVPLCPLGPPFYVKGARFWEEKASKLKDAGRLVVDEASVNYETTWMEYGGLGDEPVQFVKAVIRTNVPAAALESGASPAGSAKPARKKEPGAKKARGQGAIAGSPLTTNEILKAAAELQRDLQQKYQTVFRRSNELLIEMTLDQVTTDDEGHYVFRGDAVQPGNFVISAKYDVLSAEGKQIEFMWFHPVNLSLRRFAFNKSTVVNLDELNQSRPPFLDVYVPTRDEIFLELVDELKKAEEKPDETDETDETTNVVSDVEAHETTNVVSDVEARGQPNVDEPQPE